MGSIDEIYAGNSLKAEDLRGRKVTVTIQKAEVKNFDRGPKIVLTFLGAKKTFVVNKTNANRIAKLHGSRDYNSWIGKPITLMPDTTEFKGEFVDCIRVAMPEPASAPPPTQGGTFNQDLNDEIPF